MVYAFLDIETLRTLHIILSIKHKLIDKDIANVSYQVGGSRNVALNRIGLYDIESLLQRNLHTFLSRANSR